MTTAEIILNVQDKLRTDITTDSAVCSIENAVVTGCYKCAKGAETKVTCRASKKIHAEVTCGDASFTIECDEKGITSALKLSFRSVRIYQKCKYSCGRGTSTFEIAGILKFTHMANGLLYKWVKGETTDDTEFSLPDLWHITDVFMNWYKCLMAAIIGVLLLLFGTYIFLTTCGARIFFWTIRMIVSILLTPVRMFFRAITILLCKKPHTSQKKII